MGLKLFEFEFLVCYEGARPFQCHCLRKALPNAFPVLHFYAPRLIALRGGDMNEETSARVNERQMHMRRACALALRQRSFLLLESSLKPTPSPFCGLASWPLLGVCSMYPGEKFLNKFLLFGASLNSRVRSDVKYICWGLFYLLNAYEKKTAGVAGGSPGHQP